MTRQLIPQGAVFLKDGHPVTTSTKIAEIFEKRHERVLSAVRALDCSEEFRQHNFVSGSYRDAQNQTRPMFELTKDGFTFLVMGFSGPKAAKFKEAYIRRFNEMEQTQPVSRSTIELDEAEYWKLKAENAELRLALMAGKNEPRRRNWRDEEVSTLIILTRQGLSRKAIGERLGRSTESVETKQRDLRSRAQL